MQACNNVIHCTRFTAAAAAAAAAVDADMMYMVWRRVTSSDQMTSVPLVFVSLCVAVFALPSLAAPTLLYLPLGHASLMRVKNALVAARRIFFADFSSIYKFEIPVRIVSKRSFILNRFLRCSSCAPVIF